MRWARRTEWVNRASFGSVMLARLDGERRTLRGLATAVWIVLDEPADRAEVLDRLADLGPDDDLTTAEVDKALEMLVEAEVIRLESDPV